MTNIIKTIEELPDLLAFTPASNIEISNAELQLCLHFAEEYKTYLSEFGAVIADGIELMGIAKSEHRNVVIVTKQEWELNLQVPHNLYVVQNMGVDGIIIWQDGSGAVYQTTPNNKPLKIAESLEGYLKSCGD